MKPPEQVVARLLGKWGRGEGALNEGQEQGLPRRAGCRPLAPSPGAGQRAEEPVGSG